jgi:hypothetical protein
MIFDASNRDQCEVKRPRTNTPLQALIMMNDPIVLESSLALADRLLQKNTPEKTTSIAFRRIICRNPQQKELDVLNNYYKEQLQTLRKNTAAAEKIVAVGHYKPVTSSKADLAALMLTIQIIYNLEEAITKT